MKKFPKIDSKVERENVNIWPKPEIAVKILEKIAEILFKKNIKFYSRMEILLKIDIFVQNPRFDQNPNLVKIEMCSSFPEFIFFVPEKNIIASILFS